MIPPADITSVKSTVLSDLSGPAPAAASPNVVTGANVAQGALSSLSGDGLASQFGIGLLLGLVWSPCVGPTLGAATTLAAQGTHLGQIALLMIVFGMGAGVPLLVLGSVSRASLLRSRGLLASLGRVSKTALGMLFVVLGVIIFLGYDRNIESALLSVSPMWLTRLTTSI